MKIEPFDWGRAECRRIYDMLRYRIAKGELPKDTDPVKLAKHLWLKPQFEKLKQIPKECRPYNKDGVSNPDFRIYQILKAESKNEPTPETHIKLESESPSDVRGFHPIVNLSVRRRKGKRALDLW